MGKRSNFPRRAMDDYDTPADGVKPLLPFLEGVKLFAEPCAGRGHLVRHLEAAGLICVWAAELRDGINPRSSSIGEGIDALACGAHIFKSADIIITNPPWTRQLMHPLIWHLCSIKPTWLLFDADWAHTRQAAALVRHCSKVVSVGRVKWIEGTAYTGKDNAAWYLFERAHTEGPRFYGRAVGELALEAAA